MSTSNFSFTEAIGVVEGYFAKDPHVESAQHYFEEELKTASPRDHEKRGNCYYYLLRLLLKGHMPFENPIAKNYYDKMTEHFELQEQAFKQDVLREPDNRKRSVKLSQLKAFYKLIERYYTSLEAVYTQNGFLDAKDRAYYRKMRFRKHSFLYVHQYFRYMGYSILQISSRYGLSVQRWGATTLMSIFLFSLAYYLVDIVSVTRMVHDAKSYGFEYIYLSVINFTTLGLGDYIPQSIPQKMITSLEALMGYTMLGMFVHIVFKRF